MMRYALLAFLACLPGTVWARDVPANVKSFYDRITDGKCTGGKILKDGFYDEIPGSKSMSFPSFPPPGQGILSHPSLQAFAYCQDDKTGVLYLHGNGNKFANMDVDCDGLQTGPVDGRCKSSTDTQSETAFKDTVQQYSRADGHFVKDLNANFIPYVVFGNYGKKKGYTTFHPTDYNVQPLSVMAVVCGDQLVRCPPIFVSHRQANGT